MSTRTIIDQLPTVPINNNDDASESESKITKIWTPILSFLISIVGGMVVGLSSRSQRESEIYALILGAESILCLIVTPFIAHNRIRNIVKWYVIYFALAGIMSPITSWLGFKLA